MTARSVSKICSVEDCDRYAKVKEMCGRHYSNLHRYGHAVPIRDLPLKDRLLMRGWEVQPNGCWHWAGMRNDLGYGIYNHQRAHRLVYMEIGGLPLAPNEVLRHKCDNPPCVNPAHLEPGTKADNSRDMVERRRHFLHSQTECKYGHSFADPQNVRITVSRRGWVNRVCKPCARKRNQVYGRRVRAERRKRLEACL